MFARFVRHAWMLLLVSANVLAAHAFAKEAPRLRLPDVAAPESYDVRLAVDPREATFEGEVAIEVKVARRVELLWLNASGIAIERAEALQGGRTFALEVVPGGTDFVGLRGRFEAGRATLRIAYRGEIETLAVDGVFRQRERGDWYVLTQFQPIGARRAFPCFDEPRWKTPWTLTIDAPESEVVAANTPLVEASAAPSRSGWRRHRFAPTRPLPSYLVAFAVGPFEVVDGGVAGRNRVPLRYLAPRGRGDEVRYAKSATPRVLAMLEEYFGTAYPFEKLDSVAIPHLVTFGAMENVGLVTYGSQFLLARPHEETEHFRESFVGFAAHELAHMWLGNLVTLAWWDDTWLNEALASWIGTRVTYEFEPKWNNGEYRASTRAAALEADRLASARRVRNPVETRNAIDDAFDDITYYKGEEVLSMFEAWMGPESFRAGVRSFVERHAWGSATAGDFFRALGDAAGASGRIVSALRGFVDQPGAPIVEAIVDCTGAPSVVVEQRRLRPEGSTAPDLAWDVPVCFRYRADGKDHVSCAAVDAWTRRVPLAAAKSCPDWLVGNAHGRGHYVTRYWPPQLARIAERAREIPSFEMQALVGDTLLLARSGLLPLDDALRVADAALLHPAPMVEMAGVALLEGLRDEWLSRAQRAVKARIVRERVVPRARSLGWSPRAAEPADVKLLRPALLRFAAVRAEGVGLRAEARTLALRWIADTAAVDALVAPAALEVAGRFADVATFEAIERAALDAESQVERGFLLGALAGVRDPALHRRALALALERPGGRERIDGRSTLSLLRHALRDDERRSRTFAFVIDNLDALEAKLPQDTPASLLDPMRGLCTPGERDRLAAAFGARADRYMTGALRYRQALESIELCVSAMGARRPEN